MRKTSMRYTMGSLVVAALLGVTAPASASGLVLDGTELTAKERSDLRSEIERQRAASPDAFRAVFDIANSAQKLDDESRVQGAPLTMYFKALGPKALMPMVEMIAFDSHAPKGLGSSARTALRHGLVEAVGMLRDARTVPVLVKVLDKERDATGTRVAAEALARIGTDEAFGALTTALGTASGDRARAILGGLGSCRREDAARLLAQRLDAHPDEETARVLAKALGTVGNAWAWKTLAGRTDEAAVRDIAVSALLRAFMAYGGVVRTAASNAIMVVDAPQTAVKIGQARQSAARDVALALDELGQRFAKNPTR